MLLIKLPKPALRVWFIKDLCALFGKPQKAQRDIEVAKEKNNNPRCPLWFNIPYHAQMF